MDNVLRDRLIVDARRIARSVAKGNQAQWEYRKAVEQIDRDEDHSDKWKSKHRDELTKLANEAFNVHGKAVEDAARRFMQNMDKARTSFDFRDADFQAALNTLNATGKATAIPLQEKIVDAFAGNPGALDVLKEKYKSLGFGTERIESLLKPFDPGALAADEMNLTEFSAYAQANGVNTMTGTPINATWKPNGVTSMVNRITKGLNLDTTSNPYTARIAEIEQTTADPLIRVRARRFLESHRAGLEADDPATCEAAETAIAHDFAPAQGV